MDATAIVFFLVAGLTSTVLLYFVVRAAVLSALKAHSQYEREFARKVAAARATATTSARD